MERLTEAELAAHCGSDVAHIRRLAELGVIASDGEGYPPISIRRVLLVDELHRRGVALEDLGQAIATGALSFDWLDAIFRGVPELTDRTFAASSEEQGIPMETTRRLYAAFGLPKPEPGARMREDEVGITGVGQGVYEALGEEGMIAVVRPFGENLRRIAQAQVDFFRAQVIDPMIEEGLPAREILQRGGEILRLLNPASDALVEWLHRRHIETQGYQLLVQLVETALEQAGLLREREENPPAIVFLDLSGFTKLTEESGDEEALTLARGLEELAAAAGEFDGQVVKLLGDGAMLHFARPQDAVRCAVALVAHAPDMGLPAARAGVHAGPVISRDGDYFGRTVNIAARIADHARPGEVLLSGTVSELGPPKGVTYEETGSEMLRGVNEPIRLSIATSP